MARVYSQFQHSIEERDAFPDTRAHCMVSTGYGECNTPLGHNQIYELFRCIKPGCTDVSGVPTHKTFVHESPKTIVFLDLHGAEPVRIDWLSVRGLMWDGKEWKRSNSRL